MKEYSFLLPNAKLNTYHWFAFLLVLLNGVFVFYSMRMDMQQPAALFFARSALVVAFFSISFFLLFRNRSIGHYSGQFFFTAFIFITGFYFSLGLNWLAILLFLLAMLYLMSNKKLRIRISKENISYPGFLQRTIEWKELNNVILKDGLLTIDLHSDHILQVEIKESVNEKEFNDFCREQLNVAE